MEKAEIIEEIKNRLCEYKTYLHIEKGRNSKEEKALRQIFNDIDF